MMMSLNKCATILAATVLAACGSQSGIAQETPDTEWAGQIAFEGDQVVINVENSGWHSFASVTIGESETYKLIIDTGSGGSVLDSGVAEALGLEVVDQREVLSGGVEPVMLDVVRVPRIQVGDLTALNVEMVTAPLSMMTGGESHGVLGMNLFRDHLLAFNQQDNQVTVSRGSLTRGDPGVYDMSTGDGAFNVSIDVAGQQIPMHVDTGAPGGFTFPLALAESLPLMGGLHEGEPARMVGGQRDTWIAQLDGTVSLAGRAFENPPISFLDPSPRSGNLGNQITSQFLMTVDQRVGLIRFEPLDAQPVTQHRANTGRRRVGIQFGGMAGRDISVIGRVMPGSLAEQAGLQAADVVQSLNGQAMDNYDMAQLGQLFGGHDMLTFVVDRNGVEHTFEIE